MFGGQEQSSRGDSPYVLPRHPTEVDRLDVQHYALREALGANYLASVRNPAFVLDVGAGTGQWAYDLCREFPSATVIGLDLVKSKPDAPPNYRGVRANLLHGLPFGDDRIDFVHQRLLFLGVPVASWTPLVADLVRVARRGGWVELVEGDVEITPAGPATHRLAGLLRRLASLSSLDSTGMVFHSLDDYLRRAGMTSVQRRTVAIPLGEWGGRIGSLLATDCRSMYTRLTAVFASRLHVSAEDCSELIQAASEEWEQHHSTYSFAIAHGRKPLGAVPKLV